MHSFQAAVANGAIEATLDNRGTSGCLAACLHIITIRESSLFTAYIAAFAIITLTVVVIRA